MLMYALNFVQSFSAIIFITFLYKNLFGFEQRKNKILFIAFSAVSVALITLCPFIAGVNSENSDMLKETVILFEFVILPCFLFKHEKKILIPVLGLLINSTFDYIVFTFASTFKITSFYITGIFYCCLYIILIVALLLSKNRFNKEIMQDFFVSISPAFYAVIILADISAYYDVILKSDASYYVEVSNIIRIISTILMIGAVFYVVVKYSRSFRKQKESALQVEMQTKLYSEMMKKNKTIREFRHDYKNNLFSIEAMLESEKYDDAKKYIENLNGSLEKTANRYATGNYLADAIISDKADSASEKNIEIEFNGSVPEKGISNNDLCTILANALDNAIRGCESVAPCKIVIDSKESSKGVIIEIRNPVAKKVEIRDNNIKTTKTDKENHGIGLSNIKKVAEKYGGYVELCCDDEFFKIETGLYFIETEE